MGCPVDHISLPSTPMLSAVRALSMFHFFASPGIMPYFCKLGQLFCNDCHLNMSSQSFVQNIFN